MIIILRGYILAGMFLPRLLGDGVPEDNSERLIPCFFLLLLGCVNILAPIGIWARCFGMYREGEPTGGELIGIRILGGLIILGTAAWFWGYF